MVKNVKFPMAMEQLNKVAHDFSNRTHSLVQIAKLIGLPDTDIEILLFLAMGNPEDKTNLPDILKKISVPKVKVSEYNKEKLERYMKMLKNALMTWNNATVVDVASAKVSTLGSNDFITTPYGFQLSKIVYNSILHQLDKSPDYVLSVVLGVYKAMEEILKFLGVDTDNIEGGE